MRVCSTIRRQTENFVVAVAAARSMYVLLGSGLRGRIGTIQVATAKGTNWRRFLGGRFMWPIVAPFVSPVVD